MKNKLVVSCQERKEGGINWEVGIDTHYMKQVNKDQVKF